MKEGKGIAERFVKEKGSFKSGSLKFFGCWFGRPMDNCHSITSVEYNEEQDMLTMKFDNGEKLVVWQAKGIQADSRTFRITEAKKVRWEWYYYGRPQADNSLYFEEYIKEKDSILTDTDVDWYKKEFDVSPSESAVDIC